MSNNQQFQLQNQPQQQQQQNPFLEQETNFLVYVRIRPLSQKELSTPYGLKSPSKIMYSQQQQQLQQDGLQNNNGQDSLQLKSIIKVEENGQILYINDPEYKNIDKKEKPYLFNGVLHEEKTNQEIFEICCKPNLDFILQGFNATFLAYGITGSGKTHTIFGGQRGQIIDQGICFQSMNYIISAFNDDPNRETKIKFSFLEIYNETVRDLLGENSQKNLTIIEDPIKGVQVMELKEYSVSTIDQIEELINLGNGKRALAPTSQNQFSSRSHAIILLNVEFRSNDSEKIYNSKLTFIDLAGSEKGGQALTEKQQKGLLEGANINKSLLSLGNCINILADKKKNSFVPYRDSKLTRLLKDSLGGNTKTVMISCISQHYSCFEETMNTLNYSQRATNIKKKVYRNVQDENNIEVVKYKEIIRTLKSELEIFQKLIKQPISCPNCGNFNTISGESANDGDYDVQQISQSNKNSIQSSNQGDNLETLAMFENLAKDGKVLNSEIQHLFKTQHKQIQVEKNKVQSKLQQLQNQIEQQDQVDDQNNQMKEFKEEYLDRILKDIMANVEEKVEIQQSIKEIEECIIQENEKISFLSQQKPQTTEIQAQIREILNINDENEEIKNRMLSTLQVNEGQKDILKELLVKMNTENKTIQIETEMRFQKQQLESFELLQNNQELTQELHIQQQLNQQYQTKMEELEQQIKQLQQNISSQQQQQQPRLLQKQQSSQSSQNGSKSPFRKKPSNQNNNPMLRKNSDDKSNQIGVQYINNNNYQGNLSNNNRQSSEQTGKFTRLLQKSVSQEKNPQSKSKTFENNSINNNNNIQVTSHSPYQIKQQSINLTNSTSNNHNNYLNKSNQSNSSLLISSSSYKIVQQQANLLQENEKKLNNQKQMQNIQKVNEQQQDKQIQQQGNYQPYQPSSSQKNPLQNSSNYFVNNTQTQIKHGNKSKVTTSDSVNKLPQAKNSQLITTTTIELFNRSTSKSGSRYSQNSIDKQNIQNSNLYEDNPILTSNFYANQGKKSFNQNEQNQKIIMISPKESFNGNLQESDQYKQDYVQESNNKKNLPLQINNKNSIQNNSNNSNNNNQLYLYQNLENHQNNIQNQREVTPIAMDQDLDDDCEIKLQSHNSMNSSEVKMQKHSFNNNPNIYSTDQQYSGQSPINQKQYPVAKVNYSNY